MARLTRNESMQRLYEIQHELEALVEESTELLRDLGDRSVLLRAESYWLAQIRIAIGGDHGYLGGAGCSLEDTLIELEQNEEESLSRKRHAVRRVRELDAQHREAQK